jgi:hypothetical protein
MRKARTIFFVCSGLLGLAPLQPRPATAAWPTDPLVNVPICTANGYHEYPTIIADGAGGAIVTWEGVGVRAQRVSGAGAVQWTPDGVPLCTAISLQSRPTITADGAGGAIVTWYDNRTDFGDIYSQRISAGGAIQWTADGVALCTDPGYQWNPTVTSDGAGGTIVTWQDLRSGNHDIYAQRVSAAGTVQWTVDGVSLSTAPNDQLYPQIVSDGVGGAIVTWQDARGGTYCDIYGQRVSAAGTVQWTTDGKAICTITGDQYDPRIVSDGAGGAIITWQDYRNGTTPDIYAQRISAAGAGQWAVNGVAVCTAPYWQENPFIASDGAGGAIVAWEDSRSYERDIYAQRISAAGTVRWPANGVPLCTATAEQYGPTIVSDGAGGAIVAWYDCRSDYGDIYAQRVVASGAVDPAWPTDGRAISLAVLAQYYPTISTDGAGGAIVTWQDNRFSGYSDDICIYAQRVLANGQLGGDSWVSVPGEAAPAFALDPVRLNPMRGNSLTVRFTLPGETAASLEILDVAGRRIVTRVVGSPGAGQHTLDLGEGLRLAPGLYLVCLRQGTNVRMTRVVVLK